MVIINPANALRVHSKHKGRGNYLKAVEGKAMIKISVNDLVVKQQLEIESLKTTLKFNNDIVKRVKGNMISIGQPLNDNILKFNTEQIRWAMDIYDLLNQIEIEH